MGRHPLKQRVAGDDIYLFSQLQRVPRLDVGAHPLDPSIAVVAPGLIEHLGGGIDSDDLRIRPALRHREGQ